MPPILSIPSTTTPSIAHPSAVAALLLRATLTDDGHCCICELWLVWYPLPLDSKSGKFDTGDQWVMGRLLQTKRFFAVIMMSKRKMKIPSTYDIKTELVTGRNCSHSPKIAFPLIEPQSYLRGVDYFSLVVCSYPKIGQHVLTR